ncbi:hypothetical protein [Pontibacter sp. G13]|uniref:hypothetical protein n=1 Tax=Pontibacter sp. G13 TaxID=3074898 RepID=UPI00288BDD36|nr:hypothetical protein [Pontibacter sp. G13]WNJ19817.1 hypothetical protein RJD25_04980 [Pontibacter sp. G13]
MKWYISTWLVLAMLISAPVFAQNDDADSDVPKYVMFIEDHVPADKVKTYESGISYFRNGAKSHNADMRWSCYQLSDGRFVYTVPMDSYAELDEDPWADMVKKMDSMEVSKARTQILGSLTNSSEYMVKPMAELSYRPAVKAPQTRGTYVDVHYFFYTPENGRTLKGLFGEMKELWEAKGIDQAYGVDKTDFGGDRPHWIVYSVYKDEAEFQRKSKEMEAQMGDEFTQLHEKIASHCTEVVDVTAIYRPDLSYHGEEVTADR